MYEALLRQPASAAPRVPGYIGWLRGSCCLPVCLLAWSGDLLGFRFEVASFFVLLEESLYDHLEQQRDHADTA